jgi:hypothetical protein
MNEIKENPPRIPCHTLGQNWREILKRWVKIAYEDSFVLA